MNDELNFENNEPQVSFGNTTSNIEFQAPQNVVGGATNYIALSNKPKINGVELVGDKTTEDLGIQSNLIAGDNIEIKENKISVLTADKVEQDNTKPITSAAVYTEVGNINALLQTI